MCDPLPVSLDIKRDVTGANVAREQHVPVGQRVSTVKRLVNVIDFQGNTQQLTKKGCTATNYAGDKNPVFNVVCSYWHS
jgi:hypothetical protein